MNIVLQEWDIHEDFPTYIRVFLNYLEEEHDTERMAYVCSADYRSDIMHALTRPENPCRLMKILHDHIWVGFLLIRQEPEGIYLADFAVFPDYRNQGIGTAVLHQLQEKFSSIYLTASPKARTLYLRNGFAETTEIYEDNGQRVFRWTK